MCGRNFEYYSEDPLISGLSASSFVKGVQSHEGLGVACKHFCCNNQESDRTISNSTVSERALREIYLRGFEICVKDSKPKTIMSSYNKLNGIQTSSRYDLLTDILRGEWGFERFVMTDWDSKSDKILDIQAGNDIIMGGYPSDKFIACMEDIQAEFNDDGTIKEKEISMYGGVMKNKVACFNGFLPDKNGSDIIELDVVNPNVEALKQLIVDGIVEIKNNKVIYHGYNRGNCLSLSIVQRNITRVLNYLAYGAPMKVSRNN